MNTENRPAAAVSTRVRGFGPALPVVALGLMLPVLAVCALIGVPIAAGAAQDESADAPPAEPNS